MPRVHGHTRYCDGLHADTRRFVPTIMSRQSAPQVKIVVLLKRKPGMSREDFVRYYETRHAVLATQMVPGLLDYRRTYVSGDRPAFGAPADSLEFDVITTLVFADAAAYRNAAETLRRPEITRQIAEDEEHLFDRTCIRSYVAEEYVSDLS